MNYDESKTKFDAYVEQCRQEIIKQFFPNEAGLLLSNNSFLENDIDNLIISAEEKQKRKAVKDRLKLIKIKVDHTMRMVEKIIRINEEMGIKLDFQLVMKLAILYHDIGRFEQVTWSDTFVDSVYTNKNKQYNGNKVEDHGQAGKYIFLNNDFSINEQYRPIIGESIFFHQNLENSPKLQYRYDSLSEVRSLNINDILTGKYDLNDAEWHIVALITQLVADIDKTDILFQYLTGDISVFNNYTIDSTERTLDEIAKDWNVPKQEILEFNEFEESDYNNQEKKQVLIPIKTLNLSQLEVSKEFKNMFYLFCETDDQNLRETYGNLKKLRKIQQKWSFVYALWWRVSRFIKDINFYSVLVGIEECELLDQIWKLMPEEYQPLIEEPIDYAKNKLIPRKKGNSQSLYTRK